MWVENEGLNKNARITILLYSRAGLPVLCRETCWDSWFIVSCLTQVCGDLPGFQSNVDGYCICEESVQMLEPV